MIIIVLLLAAWGFDECHAIYRNATFSRDLWFPYANL